MKTFIEWLEEQDPALAEGVLDWWKMLRGKKQPQTRKVTYRLQRKPQPETPSEDDPTQIGPEDPRWKAPEYQRIKRGN